MRAIGRAVCVLLLAAAGAAAGQGSDDSLAGLPVHLYAPKRTPVGGAVFFSGDGGWRSFDQVNGDSLRAWGWYVVGVDDLRLFRREMDGDTLAALSRRLAAHVRGRIPAEAPLFLMGYSFGANIVADAAARGAPADGLYLLGPGGRGVREITVEGYLDRDPTGPTSFAVAERLNQRSCIPVAFVTGSDDRAGQAAAIFPQVRQPAAQFIVPGAGHHYHGGDSRYTAVARQALAWLAAHRRECPP